MNEDSKDSKRRVALLGGSFNPPHIGHLMAALYIHATCEVDEVWMMPTFRHPFGKTLEGFHHRVAMCEVLTSEFSGWLKVTRIEEQLQGGGRTIDTLRHLLPQHPHIQFSLVVGSDIVKDLPHWKDVDQIRTMVNFLVIQRAGHPVAEAMGPPLAEISSSEVRAKLEAGALPHGLVPRSVLNYLRAHRLYHSPSSSRFNP